MGCGCKEANTKCNCNCPPPEPGSPGTSWAIRATAEPPGSNCIYGGWRIEGGPDQDLDGLPDSIKQTFYVCNGAPGQSRAIRVEVEAPGVNCANGGYKMTTGEDADNDGIPDTNLVVSYVCNGAAGANGATPTLQIGTVTTLPSGSSATANIVSLGGNVYRVDFGIPQGPTGPGTSTSGITVAGITIPSCLTAELGGVTQLNPFLEAILEKICSMSSSISSKAYAFRAEKTTDQVLGTVGSGDSTVKVIFEDDANPPRLFDNSNSFFGDTYIADGAVSATFVVEGLTVETDASSGFQSGAGSSVQMFIVRDRGGVTTDLASSPLVTGFTMGQYGKRLAFDGSYTFPTLIALNSGAGILQDDDKVYVELRFSNALGAPSTLFKVSQGVFTCS